MEKSKAEEIKKLLNDLHELEILKKVITTSSKRNYTLITQLCSANVPIHLNSRIEKVINEALMDAQEKLDKIN